MKKILSLLAALLLLWPMVSSASNLIVVVKDIETNNPVKGAIVSVVLFNEKEESWGQEWWGAHSKENGITLHLGIEMWQKCVIRAEAKGYFTTFYGTPFYFYGVPKIVTINSANPRLEIFLQPDKESPKPEVLRTVRK